MSSILHNLDGLGWLLLTLVPLLFFQRLLHREIFAVFLLLTRRLEIASILFALIFFPGVLLHELSHFVTARLLRVRTGRLSLLPSLQPDGHLQLGFVETEQGGLLRDAIIGAAPLVAGGLLIAYAAVYEMHILMFWDFLKAAQFELFWMGVSILPTVPDFWLWFYLSLVISSTMLPSASDRYAWMPLGLIGGLLVVLAVLGGAGPWLVANLAPLLNTALRSLAALFGLSAVLHVLLMLPFALFHRIISKITGWDVAKAE